MGNVRPLDKYLQKVGLDLIQKVVAITNWCETGRVPPGMKQHQHLYPIENYVQDNKEQHDSEMQEARHARQMAQKKLQKTIEKSRS